MILACAVLAALLPAAAAAQAPDVPGHTPVSRGAEASSSISRSQLKRQLRSLMKKAPSASGAWVYDTKGKETVFARRASKRRIPASNMKLLTTATAFARFGGAGTLTTAVWRTGTLSGSTLQGNLFLVGGGDPALAAKAFAGRTHGIYTRLVALASRLRSAGIRKVTGHLYADDTIFDRKRGVPDSNGRTSPYIGPLSGLDFDSGYRSDGSGHFSSDPAKTAATRLIKALHANGVAISGKVKLRSLHGASSNRAKLAQLASPTMATLIRETDVFSNNHWAEMLLKGLGARFRSRGTTKSGARVVRNFLKSNGISAFHQVDGSGLSRPNNVAPSAIGALLRRMRSGAATQGFQQLLPLAGHEGTLHDRMRGSAADGHCRAKTGTLHGVSALSGYCFNGNGRTMVFSILMNNVGNMGKAHLIQDKMAAAIARY